MKLGDRIIIKEPFIIEGLGRKEEVSRSGSIGCFFWAFDDKLNKQYYFTVSRHVAGDTNDDTTLLSRPVYDANQREIGKIVATTSTELDTCLVLVNNSVKVSDPNRLNDQLKITQIWNPSPTRDQLKQAPTQDAVTAIKNETLKVSHLGGTLASKGPGQVGKFNGVFHPGSVFDPSSLEVTPRSTMTERTTYAGDSGGPVFTDNGSLIGFIRRGGDQQQSSDTELVLADSVQTDFMLNEHILTLVE